MWLTYSVSYISESFRYSRSNIFWAEYSHFAIFIFICLNPQSWGSVPTLLLLSRGKRRLPIKWSNCFKTEIPLLKTNWEREEDCWHSIALLILKIRGEGERERDHQRVQILQRVLSSFAPPNQCLEVYVHTCLTAKLLWAKFILPKPYGLVCPVAINVSLT